MGINEHIAGQRLDENGQPFVGGGGGGGEIISGTPGTEPAQIVYVAPVSGVKAFMRLQLDSLPNNDDRMVFTSRKNDDGSDNGIGIFLDYTWKTVLGSPHVGAGGFDVHVRIEPSESACISNLESALNDGTYQNGGTVLSDTWTALHVGGSELRHEQDFDGIFPNDRNGFTDLDLTGRWTDVKIPLGGIANADWTDGSIEIPEVITSAVIQDFFFKFGSTPIVHLLGSVESGAHTPEVLGVVTDPNGIIEDSGGNPNITFSDIVIGSKTFRIITIPPVKDAGTTGIATVNWTWNGKSFSAQIQK